MKITFDFKDPKIEKPNPKSDFDTFLVVTNSGCILCVSYSIKYDLFNAHDFTTLREAKKTAIYPRWWAEIPLELEILERDKQL